MAEALNELAIADTHRHQPPLDRWRRQQMVRVEQEIVPLNGSTLCLAEIEEVREPETEGAHQTRAIERADFERSRVNANEAVRCHAQRRRELEWDVDSLVQDAALPQLSAHDAERQVAQRRVLISKDVLIHKMVEHLRTEPNLGSIDADVEGGLVVEHDR